MQDLFHTSLKNCFKSRCPKTGLQHLRPLHDNAPAHKTRIVTEYLEAEKVTVLPHPPLSPDLDPATIFCFPNLNTICLERNTSALESAVYQYLIGFSKEVYKQCSKSGLTGSNCVVRSDREYFEGQSKLK